MFFAFSSINTSKKLPLKTYHCLAGLSQFYSLGIVAMAAFVAPLHRMCIAAQKHRRAPSSEAKFVLRSGELSQSFCILIPLSSMSRSRLSLVTL